MSDAIQKSLVAFLFVILLSGSSMAKDSINTDCLGALGEANGIIAELLQNSTDSSAALGLDDFLETLDSTRIQPAVLRVMAAYAKADVPSNPFLEHQAHSTALRAAHDERAEAWEQGLPEREHVLLSSSSPFQSLTDPDAKAGEGGLIGMTMAMAPHSVGIVNSEEEGPVIVRFVTGFDEIQAALYYPGVVQTMDLIDQVNDQFFANQTHFPDLKLAKVKGYLTPGATELSERLAFVSPVYVGRFEKAFQWAEVSEHDRAWAEALHFLYGSVDVDQIERETETQGADDLHRGSGFRNTVLTDEGRFIAFGPTKPFPGMKARLNGDRRSLGTYLPDRYPKGFDSQLTSFIEQMRESSVLPVISQHARIVMLLRAEIMLADMAIRTESGENVFLED